MRQLKISQQITHRNENSVNLYFQEVNKYPMVSIDEEVELSVRIRNGDELALRRLVEANLRFVISVAKQYQNQGLSFPDLINEGNVGLVKAAQKFDETRGFKFISYAVWWIRQSIMQAISEQTRIVRLPVNRISAINRIKKAIPFLEQQYEREPTNSELAEYLDMKENLIKENNDIKHRQVSLDKPLSNEGESDFTFYDLLHNDNLPSPDSDLDSDSARIDIIRAVNKLGNREKDIITFLYGLDGKEPLTLHEVSDILNVSSERVRQIREASLLRLKKILSGKSCFHDNI